MVAQIRSYRDLTVWQKACDLAQEVYSLTRQFPKEELYGIVSQMRRAAVSVPSNIAEGAEREGPAEYRRFLSIASGSLAELHTQVELARRFNYITTEQAQQLGLDINEISKMLYGLRKGLRKKREATTLSSNIEKHIQEGRQVIGEVMKATEYSFKDLTPSTPPSAPGIYVITIQNGETLRAGKTKTLSQRIYQNHLMGNQSGNLRSQLVNAGVCVDLEEAKDWIRQHCAVRWIEKDVLDRIGVEINWAEHFMLAVLRPRFSD